MLERPLLNRASPLALLLATALWLAPGLARGQTMQADPDRARAVRVTALVSGALVGAGIGVGTVADGEIFDAGASPGAVRWVSIGSTGVQTLSSAWATLWFADVTLRHPRGPWRNIGWGILYGMAAGAMSYGTGFGTLMTLGWATDTISVGEVVDRWWKVVPLNYGVGSGMGAIACIPVGALLAPSISLTMRW